MAAKEISVNPNDKTINIFMDDTTVNEIKSLLKHFVELDDYEVFIHNPNQSTDLIEVYYGNIQIDNLYKVNEAF